MRTDFSDAVAFTAFIGAIFGIAGFVEAMLAPDPHLALIASSGGTACVAIWLRTMAAQRAAERDPDHAE
jgi:hypothetical protein